MNTWADGTRRVPYITAEGQIDRAQVMQIAARQAKGWQRQFPGTKWPQAMQLALDSLWPTVRAHKMVVDYRREA